MHHKTRLCLSALLAGLSASPVWAQSSNVTIYGVADTFYAYGKAGKDRFSGPVGGGGLYGNRLGFKGVEDLGNGLSAIYTFEYGSSLTGNTGLNSSRQSFVGVKSSQFGAITGGRQYAPGYYIPPAFEIMEGSGAFASRSNLAFAGGYTIAPGGGARYDNSVAYASPQMGGFGFSAIYGFGSNETSSGDTSAQDDDRFGLGATYAVGALRLGAVYHQTGVANQDDTREFYLGGSYDFGVARVVASWSKKDADGSTSADSSLVNAGVIVPVSSAGSVHVGYGRLNPEGGDNNGEAMVLGYIHQLSKRTSVYGAINRLRYDGEADYTSNPGAAVSVAAAGETANTVLVGIDHRF